MKSNRFWLTILGITTILFWGLMAVNDRIVYVPVEYSCLTIPSMSIVIFMVLQSLIKFMFYLNLILWFNSVFMLKTRAEGIDTETWEFQKRQVSMTLFIFVVLIIMEIPLWLSVL